MNKNYEEKTIPILEDGITTAILVDGDFYLKRSRKVFGNRSPEDRAKELYNYCTRHLTENHRRHKLYRIFYYDCPPMTTTVYHPLRKDNENFSSSQQSRWRKDFHSSLKRKRKVALRMGRVSENRAAFLLNADVTKKLFNKSIDLSEITEKDFHFTAQQKGVDMKIGLDISALAYKKLVDQIILISGDSDFVPAAKMARREGIDFILDPLGHHIKDDLSEHIDGLRSCDKAFLPMTNN
ncbi:NYN domain-containing protein [Pseudoramibacter alactolyticus]|uniref:NYN domain-containing protein n=1 Tax=Pseudoramibacter alactolyticus TaxID=113287 RepID=UPI0028ECEADB|nr:NYN domain-containing protein [Pseudoramibacter alactolyticus]